MDKLLIVCLSKARGGLEQVVLKDCELLTKDFEVSLLCIKDSYLHQTAKVSTIPISHMTNYFDLQSFKFAHFDYYYIHQSGLLSNFRIFKSPSKKIAFHSHIFSEKSKRSIFHRWIYQGIDQVFGISQEHVENLKATLPLKTKVEWIPLPLDAPGDLEVPLENKYVCFSRIDPHKGQDFLLELMRRLPNATLDIIGSATPGYEKFAEELQEKAPSNVRFLGFLEREKLLRNLSAYEVCFMPSRKETLGLVALESLVRGVPTLVFKNAVSKDLQGFCTELDASLDAFVDCLQHKKFIKPQRELILKRYSLHARREKLLSVFNKSL